MKIICSSQRYKENYYYGLASENKYYDCYRVVNFYINYNEVNDETVVDKFEGIDNNTLTDDEFFTSC